MALLCTAVLKPNESGRSPSKHRLTPRPPVLRPNLVGLGHVDVVGLAAREVRQAGDLSYATPPAVLLVRVPVELQCEGTAGFDAAGNEGLSQLDRTPIEQQGWARPSFRGARGTTKAIDTSAVAIQAIRTALQHGVFTP